MNNKWNLLLIVELILLAVSAILRECVFRMGILTGMETFFTLLVMVLFVLVIITAILRFFAE